MDKKFLQNLLIDVAEGRITPGEAAEKLKTLPYEDIDFAKIDRHRGIRTGRGEVVFGIGKTPEQVAAIMKRSSEGSSLVIATKVGPEYYEIAKEELPEGLTYYDKAKLLVYQAGSREAPEDYAPAGSRESLIGLSPLCDKPRGIPVPADNVSASPGIPCDHASASTEAHADHASASPGIPCDHLDREKEMPAGNPQLLADHGEAQLLAPKIAVVCAGTADIPIAEEAAITSELYGVAVDRYYDVGVAGIHRLLDNLEDIRKAKAIVVAAGMEGALSSVLGGLVDVPVIAVPTSIGYGASLGGFAAMLTMLNSCSLGVSVVNIDNGFGAGYLASMYAKGKE